MQARQALADPDAAAAEAARAFLTAPGIVMGVPSQLPSAEQTARCVEAHECTGSRTTPVSYAPGSLVYDLEVQADTRMVANEAYYPGWSVLLVDVHGRVFPAEPQLGPAGMLAFDVPEGLWRVSMVYETPHAALAAVSGWTGLASALTIWWALGPRRRARARVVHAGVAS